ncbi:unnamed protein product [Taenia asiatica]|uniref:Protein kinase domain-containing protein n=1 Tax=Taenia asiatica TaxID=60517 RepID=A0A0R3VWC7_TAEAS|nr:unnamed protein product [Taenia asiatica]
MKVTTKADMWSLGVLVATTIYGRMTISGLLRRGGISKDDFQHVSTPLRLFFRTCLSPNRRRRMDISNVKRLEFYEDVNWEEVMACKLEPPYHPSQIEARDPYRWGACEGRPKQDPCDRLILAAANRKCMPLIDEYLLDFRDRHGVRHLMEQPTCRRGLLRVGLTPERINELFANFGFINRRLVRSFRRVKRSQICSGNQGGSSECKQGESRGSSNH